MIALVAAMVHEIGPVMGGEDFAYYLERVPGCFIVVGVGSEAGPNFSVHHPTFEVNEDALPVGSAMHASFAMKALGANGA